MSEPLVHIVGPNGLQNELLVSFLGMKAGLECKCSPALGFIVDKEPVRRHLVLLDCLGTDLANFWTGLGVGLNFNLAECLTVLFNVDPDVGIEREAVDQGVRGIFYDNEPLERFAKGVLAVLNGEMWYPRKTLSKCVLEPKTRTEFSGKAATVLTSREKEILIKIASGASNKEIADELCISRYTVKAHAYNIYKKMKVSNRLQATLQVGKYV